MFQLSARRGRVLALWVSSIFLIFGCLLALAGAMWLWSRVDYVRGGSEILATVVKLEAIPSGGKGSPAYVPSYRFTGAAGEIREVRSGSNVAGGEVRVGETVRLIYNASNETELLINRFGIIYQPPLFVTGFGTIFALASFLGLRRACRG